MELTTPVWAFLIGALVSQVCRWVLKYRTSKNPLIQMTILNLLPRLAAFQPHNFTGVQHNPNGALLLYCVLCRFQRCLCCANYR